MTNRLTEWIGKGFWFLSTSLCDAMVDMVVGDTYNINSLCFKNEKNRYEVVYKSSVCVCMCIHICIG